MLKQFLHRFLRKRARILRGIYRTYMRGDRKSYEPSTWWDNKFFTKGLSDKQTITRNMHPIAAAYHYASVEILILRHLRNKGRELTASTICDLGSGAGHWIDFYLSLGAFHCLGIDVSRKSVDFLRAKYMKREEVTIEHGRIHEVLARADFQSDLVNAIGVMFHVVDDEEWEETVRQVGRVLRAGGLFIVGGHFGLIDGVNVQFLDNVVNKRLRSASHWKRSLKQAGFVRTRIYRNSAYLYIRDWIPENNVLITEKS